MIKQHPALTDAEPHPFWIHQSGPSPSAEPLVADTTADLAIVGGGFTGLWAAIGAKERWPERDVVLLEMGQVGSGASGRNGGFVSNSLTHGLVHGSRMWPDELPELVRLGRANLDELSGFLRVEGIDAGLSLCGKTVIATRPHEESSLRGSFRLHQQHGEDVEWQDREMVRADVASPTYRAAMRVRSGGGLVDPYRLVCGLKGAAERRGVRIHERTAVTSLDAVRGGVVLRTRRATVRARSVVLATNAFPPLLRRIRQWIVPVYDHVLVSEPLNQSQLDSLGWRERQGLTDAGNQFHYYRLTSDDRILWGGYDAIYYFGNRTDARLQQRDASHSLLARQFFHTFPQLRGLRFTHRWAGLIDTTSRFTPMFGAGLDHRVAYAVGYTGLGVASSRFGANVALDLIAGTDGPGRRLRAFSARPVPFPPEPLRYLAIQATRASLAREDSTGYRNAYLRLLDRFGVGYNS